MANIGAGFIVVAEEMQNKAGEHPKEARRKMSLPSCRRNCETTTLQKTMRKFIVIRWSKAVGSFRTGSRNPKTSVVQQTNRLKANVKALKKMEPGEEGRRHRGFENTLHVSKCSAERNNLRQRMANEWRRVWQGVCLENFKAEICRRQRSTRRRKS